MAEGGPPDWKWVKLVDIAVVDGERKRNRPRSAVTTSNLVLAERAYGG